MKVALVHDWLTGLRGGERCLQAFLDIYPTADVFTLVHVPGTTDAKIDEHVVATSFLNRIPGIGRWYRYLFPLYPAAARSLHIEGYDLVISLSHAAAKNVTVSRGTPHVSYCFTPIRYIWDQCYEYFGALTPLLWPVIASMRGWDRRGARGVTEFVAISNFIRARIRCFYHRDSSVVYPPVRTDWITPISGWSQGEAFLFAGALVPYKKPALVVEALNRIGAPLWIVGTGQEEEKLRKMAGPNVTFFGHVSDEELADIYRRSRALVFPGTEDFGLMPVEVMAAGRPVIGVYDGGLKDSVRGLKYWRKDEPPPSSPTGVFYPPGEAHQLDSLVSAIYYFIDNEAIFTPESCIIQASRFSPQVFEAAWGKCMDRFGFGVGALHSENSSPSGSLTGVVNGC